MPCFARRRVVCLKLFRDLEKAFDFLQRSRFGFDIAILRRAFARTALNPGPSAVRQRGDAGGANTLIA